MLRIITDDIVWIHLSNMGVDVLNLTCDESICLVAVLVPYLLVLHRKLNLGTLNHDVNRNELVPLEVGFESHEDLIDILVVWYDVHLLVLLIKIDMWYLLLHLRSLILLKHIWLPVIILKFRIDRINKQLLAIEYDLLSSLLPLDIGVDHCGSTLKVGQLDLVLHALIILKIEKFQR